MHTQYLVVERAPKPSDCWFEVRVIAMMFGGFGLALTPFLYLYFEPELGPQTKAYYNYSPLPNFPQRKTMERLRTLIRLQPWQPMDGLDFVTMYTPEGVLKPQEPVYYVMLPRRRPKAPPVLVAQPLVLAQ